MKITGRLKRALDAYYKQITSKDQPFCNNEAKEVWLIGDQQRQKADKYFNGLINAAQAQKTIGEKNRVKIFKYIQDHQNSQVSFIRYLNIQITTENIDEVSDIIQHLKLDSSILAGYFTFYQNNKLELASEVEICDKSRYHPSMRGYKIIDRIDKISTSSGKKIIKKPIKKLVPELVAEQAKFREEMTSFIESKGYNTEDLASHLVNLRNYTTGIHGSSKMMFVAFDPKSRFVQGSASDSAQACFMKLISMFSQEYTAKRFKKCSSCDKFFLGEVDRGSQGARSFCSKKCSGVFKK
jgi:hypothetical protein